MTGASRETTYMVIERYRDAAAVYERFRASGRMLPPGVVFVDSWVDASLVTCYQVMRAEQPSQLEEWMHHWADLVDFEVHEVVSTRDAAARFDSA
jgi:hypothetical protein